MQNSEKLAAYAEDLENALLGMKVQPADVEVKLVLDEGVWFVGVVIIKKDGKKQQVEPFFKVGKEKAEADTAAE